MKKLSLWLLGSMLLCAAGYAQVKPVMLGKAPDLLTSFRKQFSALPQQRVTGRLALRINALDSLPGKINFRQSLTAGQEYLVGEIENVPGSSFFIRFEGNRVQGNIILRNAKKAYTYNSDDNGNVYIEETDIHKVLCIDFEKAPVSTNSSLAAAALTAGQLYSLQSYPNANGVVLLDFDGQYVSGTGWNSGNPISAAPSTLTEAERYEVWQLVSEDFRPFKLNITTSEAVYNSYPANRRMRCIFTPTNTAAPGAGGVAYLNSFTWGNETPCWVFNGGVKGAGDAGAHEVGHTFGLSHDGRTNPVEEYYLGQGNWAPIMGAGYYVPVVQWSKGEYANPSQTQDDLAIIANNANGVGYRADDHSNTRSGATPLSISGTGSAFSNGIIETTSDADFFTFTTTGGAVSLNINPAEKHPNLDVLATLYDNAGFVVTSSNPTALTANLSATLAAGTYYVSITGVGYGDPATTGYTNYGSLGYYSISGNIAGGTANTVATFYKDCNYTGSYAVSLAPGAYTASDLVASGISDKDISSFTVASGYEVLLYKNNALQGSYTSFNANTACLVSAALNDSVSSLRIRSLTNQAPTVNFLKPVSGTKYLTPATVAITVNAADADGAITKVEFYNGSTKLGESTTSPYSYAWNNVTTGNYTLIATATDDRGGQSSAQITISVTNVPVVTVYRDCNYGGTAVGLLPGSYTLSQLQSLGINNDDISSLRVTSGYQVQLFNDNNFAGTVITLTADNSCLVANSFNDLTSSLKISAIGTITAATVYRDCDYAGTAISLSPGNYTLTQLQALGILNDDISSLKVNSGYQVQLYADDNFLGTSQTFGVDNSCLVTNGFNDAATSIKVYAVAPAKGQGLITGLQIYPNPVLNEVRLRTVEDLTGALITVYDFSGRAVLSTRNTNNRLNVSRLSAGVYTLTIIKNEKIVSGRFVK
ncbi:MULTISPECIES: beta/gamma crystallin-related protein [Niastella]|uniref:T9SS type A sorting domain-containing protein n=1 Tax=Niastella soli TaxID=2821487 RepID=A0ABS3YU35_9BACT|nr:beta/gamma crystallin-related protein [Niastella soli]MBO9201283.1 T9SS type A sorting domain-containing protein [Niastella soli]